MKSCLSECNLSDIDKKNVIPCNLNPYSAHQKITLAVIGCSKKHAHTSPMIFLLVTKISNWLPSVWILPRSQIWFWISLLFLREGTSCIDKSWISAPGWPNKILHTSYDGDRCLPIWDVYIVSYQLARSWNISRERDASIFRIKHSIYSSWNFPPWKQKHKPLRNTLSCSEDG